VQEEILRDAQTSFTLETEQNRMAGCSATVRAPRPHETVEGGPDLKKLLIKIVKTRFALFEVEKGKAGKGHLRSIQIRTLAPA
jgi:hypothetical protein